MQMNLQAQSEWEMMSHHTHMGALKDDQKAENEVVDAIFTDEMRHSLQSTLNNVEMAVVECKTLEEMIALQAHREALGKGEEPPKKTQGEIEFEAEEKRMAKEAREKEAAEEKEKSSSLSSTKTRLMERVQQYRYNDKMRNDLEVHVKAIQKQRRMGHRQPNAEGEANAPDLIRFNKTAGLTYGRKEVRLERVQGMASKRKTLASAVKARRDESNKISRESKLQLVLARAEAHEDELRRRQEEQEQELLDWRHRTLFPMLAFCSRFGILATTLVEDRKVRLQRKRVKRAGIVILNAIRRRLRRKKLKMLKHALPKMREALRGWIRRMLQRRREKAVHTVLSFCEATGSMGDVPMAVRKFLHKVRVLQRTIRGHYRRIKAIVEIRMGQIHAHELELEKQKKRVDAGKKKGGEPSAAEKRKLRCEVEVCRKFLKRQMLSVGDKLAGYRQDLAHWKVGKAQHDRIEEARAAVMESTGIKDIKKRYKPPPPAPHLVLGLKPDEVKMHIKEAAKLGRAGVKDKEDKAKKENQEAELIDNMASGGKKKPPMRAGGT